MTMVTEGPRPEELPERWSAKAKGEVVLRLEGWRRVLLEAGLAGLKARHGEPEERALKQVQAKVGELTMKLELAELLLEKGGYAEELTRLKKSRGGVSVGTGRRYPLTMICAVWRVARSTVYAQRGAAPPPAAAAVRPRGPRSPYPDAEVVAAMRAVLAASPFHSEGHRKLRVRLRSHGIWVGRRRVLRLAREPRLLAPTRWRHAPGDRAHTGTITATRPDELWGTDATRFPTRQEGWCWFFGAIDHCSEDVVGWHVAKVGDRGAALEPIRQGVPQTHGGYHPKIALGLGVRMDWGPQYTADPFLGELRWLGIRPSPSYVGEPECNGVMERWIRTLKEECLYLHDFATLDEARQVIGPFIERYNHEWLIERHGYRTPADIRRALTPRAAA